MTITDSNRGQCYLIIVHGGLRIVPGSGLMHVDDDNGYLVHGTGG